MWLEGKFERKINCIGFENKKLNVCLKLVQSGRVKPVDTENTKNAFPALCEWTRISPIAKKKKRKITDILSSRGVQHWCSRVKISIKRACSQHRGNRRIMLLFYCAHCKSGVKMNINRKGKNALTNRSSRTVKSVVGFAKGAKPTPLLPARWAMPLGVKK